MIIAGVDTSFFTKSEKSLACLVYINSDTFQVVYEDYLKYMPTIQYQCGMLGQRECPAYITLINRAPYKPDVIFVDGYGVLHPTRYGSAVRLGEAVQLKTIGVAKNLMEKVVTVTAKYLKYAKEDSVQLKSPSGELLGVAWRDRNKFKNFKLRKMLFWLRHKKQMLH
jgi:deoxyinosine 3'endonuclease (endonuclease V)